MQFCGDEVKCNRFNIDAPRSAVNEASDRAGAERRVCQT